MKSIKVAAPAKINLTLEVLDKRKDGFHNIKSVMQAISLYDYLSFSISDSNKIEIKLTGNSQNIPYDEKNLVYKAIQKYFEKALITNQKVDVYIEKNIPIEAGLAGGSTDAAATFFALNKLYNNKLTHQELEELCASLGSDLNFCLNGGTAICTGRGENIKAIKTPHIDISLIKPTGFGISAKEAYTKFSQLLLEQKIVPNNSDKMVEKFDESLLYNSLEFAVINDYQDLQEIKEKLPNSMMSGSGPTFFVLNKHINKEFDKNRYIIIEELNSIPDGIKVVC